MKKRNLIAASLTMLLALTSCSKFDDLQKKLDNLPLTFGFVKRDQPKDGLFGPEKYSSRMIGTYNGKAVYFTDSSGYSVSGAFSAKLAGPSNINNTAKAYFLNHETLLLSDMYFKDQISFTGLKSEYFVRLRFYTIADGLLYPDVETSISLGNSRNGRESVEQQNVEARGYKVHYDTSTYYLEKHEGYQHIRDYCQNTGNGASHRIYTLNINKGEKAPIVSYRVDVTIQNSEKRSFYFGEDLNTHQVEYLTANENSYYDFYAYR